MSDAILFFSPFIAFNNIYIFQNFKLHQFKYIQHLFQILHFCIEFIFSFLFLSRDAIISFESLIMTLLWFCSQEVLNRFMVKLHTRKSMQFSDSVKKLWQNFHIKTSLHKNHLLPLCYSLQYIDFKLVSNHRVNYIKLTKTKNTNVAQLAIF